MAINGNQFNPDDQNQQQNGQQGQGGPTSQPVNISGSAAQDPGVGAAGGSATNTNTGTNPKPTSSGRFQNLGAYLKANQGFNAQGGGLAGSLNQNLTSRANDLQKNFAQAQTDYQTQLDNARQRYDGQFVNNTLQNPTGSNVNQSAAPQTQMGQTPENTGNMPAPQGGNNLNTTGNMVQSPENSGNMPANPGQVNALTPAQTGLSQDDMNRFQQMMNASYKGPSQLDPNLQAQTDNFSGLANNVDSEQGRFNLLKQIYNKPSYTSGQQTLDNLFLQSNPDQLASLQSNKVLSNQINNQYGQAQANAASQAIDAANEANNTRDQTRNAFTGAVTGFDSSITPKIQQALKDRDAAYYNQLTGLQNNNVGISSDLASKFGLFGATGQHLGDKGLNIYNLDPGKYLQESTFAPTNQNVASADDYGRIAALQKLGGTAGLNDNTSKIFDSYNNPALAGTFQSQDPTMFNTAGFTQDYNNVKSQYEGARNPLQGQLDAYNSEFNDPGNGLNTQLTNQAGTLRSQQQATYQQAQQAAAAMGMTMDQLYANQPGGVPVNPNGISDLDLLSQYKQEVAGGGDHGGTTGQYTNPYESFVNKYKSEDQQRTNRQASLSQLANQYGLDRTLSLNDADKYTPTTIANPTRGGLAGAGDFHSSPTQEPASNATAAQLAALNSIYRR